MTGFSWTDKWSKKNAMDGIEISYLVVGLSGGKEVTFFDTSSSSTCMVKGKFLKTPTLKSIGVIAIDDQTASEINQMRLYFYKVKGATDYILWEKEPASSTKFTKNWQDASTYNVAFGEEDPSDPTGLAWIDIDYPHPFSTDSQKFLFAVQASDGTNTSYPIDLLKPSGKGMTHWEVADETVLQPTVVKNATKSAKNTYGDVLNIQWTKLGKATRYVIYREDPDQPGKWIKIGGFNYSAKGITLTSTKKVQYLEGDSFRIAVASGKTPLSGASDPN